MINAHQTKEEETGNVPEKEFRIMIVKMIQNLENKMELQINRLETRIENIQLPFTLLFWVQVLYTLSVVPV